MIVWDLVRHDSDTNDDEVASVFGDEPESGSPTQGNNLQNMPSIYKTITSLPDLKAKPSI